jgi:putative Flp pilus-assembly TadE/G-like protein
MTRNSQKGQSLVFVAAALVVILGVMGLAIDMGYLRYMKRQMQSAADAAAVAAAGEIDFGDWNSAGLKAASLNNFTNGTGGVTVNITHPPPAGDAHAGNNYFVQASISENAPTFFSKIFGINSVPMTVKAEAVEPGGTNCIFALSPNGTGLSVVALAAINSACGIVVDSSSSSAITCALGATINASSIGVVGNVTSFLCTVHPTPTRIRLPNPTDPLAAWAAANAPSTPPGTCGTTTTSPYVGSNVALSISGPTPVVLRPGTYCGGIRLLPGANATFLSGVYILKSTNNAGASIASYGLTVDLAAAATTTPYNGVNGVMFYNYGPAGGFNFTFAGAFSGTGVNFHAPTSGQYEGILFFQPSTNTNAAQIIGTPAFLTTLEGTYYIPNAAVNFAFSGPVNYNILIGKTINFFIFTFGGGQIQGATFNKDYTSLADGSPVKGGYGVLVE